MSRNSPDFTHSTPTLTNLKTSNPNLKFRNVYLTFFHHLHVHVFHLDAMQEGIHHLILLLTAICQSATTLYEVLARAPNHWLLPFWRLPLREHNLPRPLTAGFKWDFQTWRLILHSESSHFLLLCHMQIFQRWPQGRRLYFPHTWTGLFKKAATCTLQNTKAPSMSNDVSKLEMGAIDWETSYHRFTSKLIYRSWWTFDTALPPWKKSTWEIVKTN